MLMDKKKKKKKKIVWKGSVLLHIGMLPFLAQDSESFTHSDT